VQTHKGIKSKTKENTGPTPHPQNDTTKDISLLTFTKPAI